MKKKSLFDLRDHGMGRWKKAKVIQDKVNEQIQKMFKPADFADHRPEIGITISLEVNQGYYRAKIRAWLINLLMYPFMRVEVEKK